jgi:2-polyprenyl-6-methoxyphenol hydroxylase-like FAD-dependent oxidoreductase
VAIADFSHLPVHCRYIAIMPQWDFLDFIADEARRYPGFSLHMGVKAQALLRDPASGRVCGVATRGRDGKGELRADLVVACDGRHSELRAQMLQASGGSAGLDERGAPIDVLWFRLPRHPGDGEELLGRLDSGRAMVLIDRGDYFQCAWIIRKGSLPELQRQGLDTFRAAIAALAPFLADRVDALRRWDDVKLLTVQVNRLRRWARPGLLCIGDAAHAMSPVGGVGVNLAVQDAVAAANILWPALRDLQDGAGSAVPSARTALDAAAGRVQARRSLPVRVVQLFQVAAQDFIVKSILSRPPDAGPVPMPLPLWLLTNVPPLRRLPARLIGLGLRREKLATPRRIAAGEAA